MTYCATPTYITQLSLSEPTPPLPMSDIIFERSLTMQVDADDEAVHHD